MEEVGWPIVGIISGSGVGEGLAWSGVEVEWWVWLVGQGKGMLCITFALFRSFVLHLSQLHLRAILLPTQAAYTTILTISQNP